MHRGGENLLAHGFREKWQREQKCAPSTGQANQNFNGGNYLDGHCIDPIALDAELKRINSHVPVGAGIDTRHDAY